MTDPLRLRDPRSDASAALRALIDAGRSEMPDGARLRQVASGLGSTMSTSAAASGSLAGGGGAGLGYAGAVVKVGAAVLIVGAAVGASTLRERAVPPVVTALPTETATVVVAPPAVQPVVTPEAVTHSPQPPGAPSSRDRGRRGRPTMPATAGTHAAGAEPVAAPPSSGPPSTWGSAVAILPDAPEEPGGLVPSRLVQAAQRELASNPARALEMALLHERTVGGIVEDRDFVIIEALVRLGRVDEARPRAQRFLRVFPGSPHQSEIAAPFGFDPGLQNP